MGCVREANGGCIWDIDIFALDVIGRGEMKGEGIVIVLPIVFFRA